MTTSITELPITESLMHHGVKIITKEGNKLTISFEENQPFTFQTYGSNIRKTIESFEESTNNIPSLNGDAKAALKIYLANQTMRAAEATPVPDTEEEAKKEVYMQKYSNGRLAEAVILAGKPCFLIADKEGNIRTSEHLELEDKIVKPLEFGMYMNKPYAFGSTEELNAYIDATRKETIDSLYRRIRTVWGKYVDGDEAHIVISAADTLYSYYQDRVGLTHYLFFVGNNGSGKSNNLRVFQQLAYRNMTSTDITSANIYRFLGSDEEGQGTICEDEADGIDENAEKMRIYKEGYTATGSKVMRSDSTNYGIKQQAFYTYCWKAFAAERLPDSVKAKGFNQRCIEIQCYPGLPKYDIVEIVNPAGVEEYQELLDELTETRNTLLIYRLLHWHEQVPKVQLNIDGRENQLFSPLIRVFHSTETERELLPVISRFISERREKNANSWHAYLYRTVKDLIARHQKTELEFSLIWDAVTLGLSGDFKNESHQTFESEEFGTITRKAVSESLMQIFGANQSSNRRESRKLIFNKTKLDQQSKYYDVEIQVKVVTDVTAVTDMGIGQYINGCANAAETVSTTTTNADFDTTIAESSIDGDGSSKPESPVLIADLSRPSHLSQEEVLDQ